MDEKYFEVTMSGLGGKGVLTLGRILAEAGIRYFVVDSHGIEHAEPRPLFGVDSPVYCPSGK